MPGPLPSAAPIFPEDFVREAEREVRHRSLPHHLLQRYRLVLWLCQDPHLGHEEAGCHVGLSGRQVRRWRGRWAAGDFSVADLPGRGRKATFSPGGRSPGQGHRL